jgi:hypothetical protein
MPHAGGITIQQPERNANQEITANLARSDRVSTLTGSALMASGTNVGSAFIASTLCSESMIHLRKLRGHETPASVLRGQHDFAARLRRFWKENRCSSREPRCGVTKPAATNTETTVRESPSIS